MSNNRKHPLSKLSKKEMYSGKEVSNVCMWFYQSLCFVPIMTFFEKSHRNKNIQSQSCRVLNKLIINSGSDCIESGLCLVYIQKVFNCPINVESTLSVRCQKHKEGIICNIRSLLFTCVYLCVDCV